MMVCQHECNDLKYGLSDLKKVVAGELIPRLEPGVVFALEGPLGVGKTILVRELLTQLGVRVPVVSPTFSYINEYQLPDNRRILHFDLYRIGSADEFHAMGFDELLGRKDVYSFIEWPEVIAESLKELAETHKVYVVNLGYVKEGLNLRKISVVPYQ